MNVFGEASPVTSNAHFGHRTVPNRRIAFRRGSIIMVAMDPVDPFGNCRPVHGFQKVRRIGEGTYGYVYKALDKENNNEPVALKRIILHNEEHDGFPLTSVREIRTLARCAACPFVVRLLDVVVGSNRDAVFLAFEYCEHDLSTILKRLSHPFKEAEVKTLTQQLLTAVDHLHSKWIVHRDIKLSNLLYTRHGQLKLADFGLARQLSMPPPRDLTPVVVTLWYRAPEVLLGVGQYSFAVDCWSVGCILAELLSQRPLFCGESELETLSAIFRLLGAPTERIWPELVDSDLVKGGAVDLAQEQRLHPYNNLSDRFPGLHSTGLGLLDGLLTYRPRHRLTARDALQHAYFATRPLAVPADFMPTFPSFHDDDVKQQRQARAQHQRAAVAHAPSDARRGREATSGPARGEKRSLRDVLGDK